MKRKIIFLDIDGTLTEPGSNEPPDSAIEAVRKAREEGHYVFLCTGRNYDMLMPLLKYGFDGAVASSGGYIRCGEEVIYDCPMTEDQKLGAMDVLEKNGIFRTLECLDGSYTDEGFKDFLKSHSGNGNSELLRWREQIEKELHIRPMGEYKGQPVYKIVVMSRSEEQLEEPKRALSDDFSFCIQEKNRQGFINGEVVNKKFDKGKGIKRVCAWLGIPLEDSIAIGDSMNDREMLETAGLGICMENGSRGLKELADEICPSVEEGGIWKGFFDHRLMGISEDRVSGQ